MIGIALRLGLLPHELLARTDSVELVELFAYFHLQNEELEKARHPEPADIEDSWRSLLSKPEPTC